MELTITDSKETFDSWLTKDYVTEELKASLSKAAILIVPFENLRDTPKPIFPIGTEEILRYFKEMLPDEYPIDICITDEDYQEFAFYSDYKRLGHFVIKEIAIPVFVGVISTFIYDKYIKLDETKPQIQIIDNSTNIIDNSTNVTVNNHISTLAHKKYLEPTHIKFLVTIVDTTGASKHISYEGPATEIDSVLQSLKEYEKK
jgi:hypothetical protein